MSKSIQGWILKHKGFVNFINHNLAERKGVIGGIFKRLKVGPRQMGRHTLPSAIKFFNHYLVFTYGVLGACRPVLSRFIGSSHGPLNYTGLMMWFLMTGAILNRMRFQRSRDVFQFNSEDGAEYWYRALNMLFPPSYLNNKLSAHYIEINQIYTTEMFKRYRKARQEILEERESVSDKEKRTRYITNPNYVYEPLGKDTNLVRGVIYK
ncbi:unnamed protein product [Moneuplotes crassus]|uniref:Transmembrane protein n=1 Tax=Euplotes crassus TaxID=5936 RepID=A0AAD2D579_EUPCR|nr:unnamed protein product [Moneuplotes crassus]